MQASKRARPTSNRCAATERRRRRHLRPAAVAALLAVAGVIGCTREPARPNVLWIVWDTVRADHMSLYGHERQTTPNLDRWAEGARVFDDCLATAGYTLPSHGSMFTGLFPGEHCAHNDHARLDDSYTTIAEVLRSAGYRTYLYSANPHISSAGNFDQGFDLAEHPWSPRYRQRSAEIVAGKLTAEDRSSELGETFERVAREEGRLSAWNVKAAGALAQEAILAWLDGSSAERPWFVFVNYMEAHRPLVPPREYRERFMTPDEVARSYAVDRSWLATWEYTFGLGELDEDALELTRRTYDAAIAELDELFGELIAALGREGRLDDTVVILTSDHGEHLGEQHMLDHQYSVYEPLLRVPLVLHYPERFAPGRETRPVSGFDLFPTLLELAGAPAPAGPRSHAVSLLDPQDGRVRFAEDPAAARIPVTMVQQAHPDWNPAPWLHELRTLVDGEHKLIAGSDGSRELYDLAHDSLERNDLAGERGELAARLERALERHVGSLERCEPAAAPLPELTPEQIERLKALGYLGG